MMTRFAGKSVIVTGSSGGIGRAAAVRFAREGANVMLADLKEDQNAKTLDLIKGAGGTAITMTVNVAEEEQVKAMVEKTVAEFGGLDVGVNNAGIFQEVALMHTLGLAEYQKVMAVNAQGVFLCMKYQLEHMVPKGDGAIVNTTSFSSTNGPMCAAFYCASKHAALGLTRAAGVEYASMGIRVNAVSPGSTITPMIKSAVSDFHTLGIASEDNAESSQELTDEALEKMINETAEAQGVPIKRSAAPEEVAAAILFLASEDASYMAGHNMVVDGGMAIA